MSRLPADTVGGRSSTLNLGVEGGDRPAVILRDAQVLPALRAIVEDGLLPSGVDELITFASRSHATRKIALRHSV